MTRQPTPGIPVRDATLVALLEDASHCLSCNSCRLGCAIHVPTGRLQPLRLVRLAGAGLLAELARLPEVWSCLQCQRCSATCPTAVQPSALIRRVRELAVAQGAVPTEFLDRYEALLARLQRVRWHAVAACREGRPPGEVAAEWERWAEAPIAASRRPASEIAPTTDRAGAAVDEWLGYPADLAACLTCRECSTACPIALDPDVFDPATLFRRANLGRVDELLGSPSIWLCLGCGACTAACAQGVSGHLVLAALQELARRRRRVPEDLLERLWAFEQAIGLVFLAELRQLLASLPP